MTLRLVERESPALHSACTILASRIFEFRCAMRSSLATTSDLWFMDGLPDAVEMQLLTKTKVNYDFQVLWRTVNFLTVKVNETQV